jgi:hypothetical protein
MGVLADAHLMTRYGEQLRLDPNATRPCPLMKDRKARRDLRRTESRFPRSRVAAGVFSIICFSKTGSSAIVFGLGDANAPHLRAKRQRRRMGKNFLFECARNLLKSLDQKK